MRNFNKTISLTLLILLVIMMITPVSMAIETTVNLGTADSFAVLAGSTITNTGNTIIDGDVGLHPGTVFSGQGPAIVSGEVHIADAVALQAKNDLLAAYNDATVRTSNAISAELGGTTLTPGVYSSATELQITGTLTLDGQNNNNAVFILQAGSTLTTMSGSKVELINGANYNNIFWAVGSSATLGTNSEFVGNILSSESITATTGAKIKGQLLAMVGAVTLDNNTITTGTSSSLTVRKIVTGDIGDMTLPTFEITVTGPEDFSATRTFAHNEYYTWEDLVPGEYNVTENRTGLSSEWTVSGEGAVQVVANELHLTTITNLYSPSDDSDSDNSGSNDSDSDDSDSDDSDSDDSTPVDSTPVDSTPVGSLTVEKIVSGDIGDMTLPTFEITVTGPEDFSATRTFAHDESYTWEDLVPGEYNVTENRTGLSSEWTVSGEGTVQVAADQIEMATITNNYEEVEVIPQTGQKTDYSMAMFFGSIAAILAGVGMLLGHKRKKLNE